MFNQSASAKVHRKKFPFLDYSHYKFDEYRPNLLEEEDDDESPNKSVRFTLPGEKTKRSNTKTDYERMKLGNNKGSKMAKSSYFGTSKKDQSIEE